MFGDFRILSDFTPALGSPPDRLPTKVSTGELLEINVGMTEEETLSIIRPASSAHVIN